MYSHSMMMPDPMPSVSPMMKLGAWSTAWDPTPASIDLDAGEFRILIVNEDMRSADSLKRTLRDLGYRATYAAYSGHRALALVDTLRPSLAFLDLELSDMTGFHLAHRLRAHHHRHVREMSLLAVAETTGPNDSSRARAAGFLGCLTKPVPSLEVGRWIRTLRT